MNVKKQYEVLEWAFSFLRNHNREEKVAEILLQHHLKMSRAAFFANMREDISTAIVEQFASDIKKHALTGVPVQHLTGYELFYGRKYIVNEHVLIPRFETEELVEHVISLVNKYYQGRQLFIADIGTGSGVIAITLALELPNVTVYATDISEKALKVAKKNANVHHASVQFLKGDFLQPVIDSSVNPQIIISNPPYISVEERDSLADTVGEFDPDLALFADNNGLAAYKKIITQLKEIPPTESRRICFEIGYTQSLAITNMLKLAFEAASVKTIKDMNGLDRIISAHIN
ncbi:peptide chain release factor N(5)-glutamine methyltransferase [Pseudogracilibacillus sp. SO30301A]|uniref:peptide chain release factor N(5)-glutamine methyltransferase n=1 Tax=Pseudogracilibacillus sp. SO30301A TaxID=3098291 RepID=UPI00300E405C